MRCGILVIRWDAADLRAALALREEGARKWACLRPAVGTGFFQIFDTSHRSDLNPG